jgi:NAD(P)-dependent dehydrogenase (short-subunit alcohol dehydrogenase family)
MNVQRISWICGSTMVIEQAGITSLRRPERAALREDRALRGDAGRRSEKDGFVDQVAYRYGKPDEMADAVAFLAGPRSRYISGQVLCVDGGKRCFRAEDWQRLASGGLKSVGRQTV